MTETDQWNLSHPERVQEVARGYVEAGSQIILTNTFRANRLALGHHDLVKQVETINRAGVEASLRAARGRASVFGSIGPSGKMLVAGQVSESYVGIRRQLSNATDRPIWIKANAGTPQLVGDQVVYRTTAAEYAEYGPRLFEAGARFLGGCCGTGPEFISALKEKRDDFAELGPSELSANDE